jgi:amino acid adenylation domain-containing protein
MPLSLFPATVNKPLTLIELLRWRLLHEPDQLGYIFLSDEEEKEIHLTYEKLDRQAHGIALSLQRLAAGPQRVLLLYPPGPEFIAGFFGCLYAGMIAVPAYPARNSRGVPRLRAIVADAQARVVLTTSSVLSMAKLLFAQAPDLEALHWLPTDNVIAGIDENWREPDIGDDAIAFLQYTSGSTGTPKGVMLSHANLLHNAGLVYDAVEHTSADKYVSWLPTFHDMGFMAGILQPLYAGIPVILMSPITFLQNPIRWLQAISRYKATTSGGPNFAYELCVRKISPQQRETLDLSSWSVAFNGAEPIRPETLKRFAKAFEPCGFRGETFYPCYGLAEATLIVSGGRKAAMPVVKTFQASGLQNGRAIEAWAASQDTQSLVSCGTSLGSMKIAIIDPQSLTRCARGEVGEIWLSGSSVAQGYWNRLDETERAFRAYISSTGEGPFLRTGDLGFIQDGELFITGRLKDLIIIRGLNHYPQDIELTVEQCHPSLRPGCGAAFALEVGGEDRLVVAQEIDRHPKADLNSIINKIRQEVAEEHELQLYAVLLVKSGSIPKTSSGKIQRQACKEGFLTGSLSVEVEWQSTATSESQAEVGASTSPPQTVVDTQEWILRQLGAKTGIATYDIGLNEPITQYGLDSLMAIELTQSIEANLGVTLPISILFQGTSVAELAAQVLTRLREPSSLVRPPLVSAQDVQTTYPLSQGQRALWFLYELEPESAAYNIAGALRIRTGLDAPALQHAFQMLVDRHPMLRSSFISSQKGPVQRIHARLKVSFKEEDISAWNETKLKDRLIEDAHCPFNLEQGPLLRVCLFRRSAQEHILLLAVHHIAIDFWSLAVLIDELGKLYQAEKENRQASLPKLEMQYTDYIRWQAEMVASAEGERLWAYWQRNLAGELPLLDLPTDKPRPLVQTHQGASDSIKLDVRLTRDLKAVARHNEATLYMTLLAAFQVLLYRYTGQEDIVVGCPTAGRNHPLLGALVGYFVNPVAMRASLSGDMLFKEFLAHVRQTVLAAFEHRDYPFSLLVERLKPKRDPSRSPLFQVMFSMLKAPLAYEQKLPSFALGDDGVKIELGGLSLESIKLERRVARFDLTLEMIDTEQGLVASLEYNTDLFKAPTITRLLRHFNILLEGIAANPDQTLSDLPLLTEAERQQLLVKWNETQAEYPHNSCIHDLIEAQAEQSPDAVAALFEDRQLTYKELNIQANQLAHYLKSLGVGPEILVGLCVERSLEMVVGILGILKAGGAYVPLDPDYPKDRLAFVLEDAQVSVLLTDKEVAEGLPEHKARVIYLDTDLGAISCWSKANPRRELSVDNLAYVIYTSGSTGKPKGVQIFHRSVVNFLHSMRLQSGLTLADTLFSVTTLSFDIAALEIFLPLTLGARVVFAGRDVISDGAELSKTLVNSKATAMQATPATWKLLLQAQWEGSRALKIFCGGEALSREVADQLINHCSSLWNLYGPTESTVWSTKYEVLSVQGPVPIGRPIANTYVYILNNHLQPVPVGVAGELYISGTGLARGYLNRPDLTADKFIPDPFSQQPGARMYKTGDLASYLSDGNIEFRGRVDQQVKIRGHRIELGEIEAVLAQHSKVREAVVIATEDGAGEKRLVAYIVARGEQAPSAIELRGHLAEKLPEYMLPSAFVPLKALPLTPNGKVARRALPASDLAGHRIVATFIAPRTPIEEVLAGIWVEALGLDQVGIYDNFFELGGHSLLASQLLYLVRNTFQVKLSARSLFEAATVAKLSAAIIANEAKPGQTEKIAQALKRVKSMSAEDAMSLLQKNRQGHDHL